jgi:ankyrin repeat protein
VARLLLEVLTSLLYPPLLHFSSIHAAIIQRGADVNSLDKHSATPLHKCCEHAHALSVSLLLSASANLNLREKVYGRLPLHSAARSGCEAAVLQLAHARADINATDAFARTALHESCWNPSAAHHYVRVFVPTTPFRFPFTPRRRLAEPSSSKAPTLQL